LGIIQWLPVEFVHALTLVLPYLEAVTLQYLIRPSAGFLHQSIEILGIEKLGHDHRQLGRAF
jgi:hypothetical protein